MVHKYNFTCQYSYHNAWKLSVNYLKAVRGEISFLQNSQILPKMLRYIVKNIPPSKYAHFPSPRINTDKAAQSYLYNGVATIGGFVIP